jgi:hypothetical protein
MPYLRKPEAEAEAEGCCPEPGPGPVPQARSQPGTAGQQPPVRLRQAVLRGQARVRVPQEPVQAQPEPVPQG